MAKRVLITGGSRGIGAATVPLLQERGWEVVAPTRQECDLTKERSVFTYIEHMPACEGMILNAHQWYSARVAMQEADDYYAQFAYVIGHAMLLKGALERDTLQTVVGVSSTRGLIGGVESGPYSMAKAAMIAMMQGYAREYHGVRFNTVAPGLSATDMEAEVRSTGGCAADAIAQAPSFVAGIIAGVLEDRNANGQIWRVANNVAERVAWGVL